MENEERVTFMSGRSIKAPKPEPPAPTTMDLLRSAYKGGVRYRTARGGTTARNLRRLNNKLRLGKKLKATLWALLLVTTCSIAQVSAQEAPQLRLNTVSTELNGQPVQTLQPVQPVTSAAPIESAKEAARRAEKARNRKMDLAYKALADKPSKFLHPFKRADLWIDYHEDQMRKYRTRTLPAGQGAATFIGMVCSLLAAFKI